LLCELSSSIRLYLKRLKRRLSENKCCVRVHLVGAQYREGFRAKSKADFVSKLQGALQELEETGYWLELLAEAGIMQPERLDDLQMR
jgi:hypothetical protein